jgi:hypothetical protein
MGLYLLCSTNGQGNKSTVEYNKVKKRKVKEIIIKFEAEVKKKERKNSEQNSKKKEEKRKSKLLKTGSHFENMIPS